MNGKFILVAILHGPFDRASLPNENSLRTVFLPPDETFGRRPYKYANLF